MPVIFKSMTEHVAPADDEIGLSEETVQAIARALADPRRFAMLREIAASEEPLPCCALEAARDVSAATMSHHMKELEAAGLVAVARKGRFACLSFRRPVFDAYLSQLAQLGSRRAL